MEKLYHKGVMRTKVDDCQFVCIAQQDYYNILHQVQWHLIALNVPRPWEVAAGASRLIRKTNTK